MATEELTKTRLRSLRALLKERAGGNVSELGRLIDRSQQQLNDIFHGRKNIGERLCRHIEEALGLPAGLMDGTKPADSKDSATLIGLERRLLDSWRWLTADEQEPMLFQIEKLAATNRRAAEYFRSRVADADEVTPAPAPAKRAKVAEKVR
jgi:hypothetical protein